MNSRNKFYYYPYFTAKTKKKAEITSFEDVTLGFHLRKSDSRTMHFTSDLLHYLLASRNISQ